MGNRLTILFFLCLCIASLCYAGRTTSECDSIRSFLESIGETEPYVSQVIEHTCVSYDSIVFLYEVGWSYNEFEGKGHWTLEPSRVKLGKDYYIRRIVNDTVLQHNLHILYNRFVSTQNNDSLIYCFQYATERFYDPFASIYYTLLCQIDFRRRKSIEAEFQYLISVMEKAVLTGDLDNIIDHSISMIPYDSILQSEIKLEQKNRSRCENSDTYFGKYRIYISNIYRDRSLTHLSGEEIDELERLLIEGISHSEHCCTAILAFAKITGIIFEKNLSEGKQLLSSIWPQIENSSFWTSLYAQESCYEKYFREHNKEILPSIDENDDSYDELKKEVIARQVLRGETPYAQYIADRHDQSATIVHSVQSQALHSPVILAIDTVTGACHLLAEDGTILAKAHIAMVDSTWYMWLSVDPLADKNPSSTPYMYCNGNPIMLIDPDGRDWFYSLDESGERVYTYNENVFSQEDMSKMKIEGTYAGITTSYNNIYYGLFGFEYTDNNDKIFAKRMDQFLIGEAMCSQSGENYHMSFVVPGLKDGQSMEFNYAGGVVLYSQVKKNSLHLEDWGHKWSNNKDFMTNKGFSGYVIKLENNKGYDPINIIYQNKSQQEQVYDLFVKTLFRRTGF